MKTKKHRFEIVVETSSINSRRRVAEVALLFCFASRQPDGMRFTILRKQPARRTK